ncbi:hypothetical protein GSI_05643 [Ganoderma sinense ZZ0214-1]|uniref:Blue (type 1) copper domain-containing protein n=1 Tax=Ganoderma sinense ZZ0214-1 TaxID=1077348 RepID=A0A2G8SFC4_9APHY|nr:hypothetical protein GSI_05643 [Ganoderma sinense ZZ0214-1]
MRYSVAVSALALATAVFAQDPIIIHVGNDGHGVKKLAFTPSSVSAPNGTIVTFVFDTPSTNHTVAQSAFAKPCAPLAGGFDSGYTPGPANAGDPPATWNLTITNDAKPIWFYCAQEATAPAHCIAGMVGAINAPAPPAMNNFAAFQLLAGAATTVAQPTPALSGLGAFASAAPTILVSSAASGVTATATASASDSSSASTSTSVSSATDSASTATPSSTTTQGNTDTTPPSSASAAPGTTTDNGAVVTTTMTSSATSSSAPASTSNAAAAGAGAVGTNGLVWAVAAVFGAALL